MNFARKVFVGIATPLLLTVTACKPDVSSGGVESTTTTTVLPGSVDTIAIGDSQASKSNYPERGLPWSERLGSNVFNGAPDNYGSGYVVPGTFTGPQYG